jgi:hypothetical protein
MCLNAFQGAGMEEYADFESGSAEVVEVKTGADSASKQVNAGLSCKSLFSGVLTAVKRRDVAGNGTYICHHEITDLSPQMIAGSTMKGAAGKTQCVRKSQPGVKLMRVSARYAGKSERSSLKC